MGFAFSSQVGITTQLPTTSAVLGTETQPAASTQGIDELFQTQGTEDALPLANPPADSLTYEGMEWWPAVSDNILHDNVLMADSNTLVGPVSSLEYLL